MGSILSLQQSALWAFGPAGGGKRWRSVRKLLEGKVTRWFLEPRTEAMAVEKRRWFQRYWRGGMVSCWWLIKYEDKIDGVIKDHCHVSTLTGWLALLPLVLKQNAEGRAGRSRIQKWVLNMSCVRCLGDIQVEMSSRWLGMQNSNGPGLENKSFPILELSLLTIFHSPLLGNSDIKRT